MSALNVFGKGMVLCGLIVVAVCCGGVEGPADGRFMTVGMSIASEPDTQLLPRLGVFTVRPDGSNLRLLMDTGTRQLSHLRAMPGGEWITATRYNEDVDGNGLAMQGEGGHRAHYGGTEIVVFHRRAPYRVYRVAGGVPGKFCANSSWTADGKLVFTQQDNPFQPQQSRIKRASFWVPPLVRSIDVVPIPAELNMPVDVHQFGRSDRFGPTYRSGELLFTAFYRHARGFMRPLWRMPATGASTMRDISMVGCPICPEQGGCCAFPTLESTIGTNDGRFHPSGKAVTWMQQDPSAFLQLGNTRVHLYRQAARVGDLPQQWLSPRNLPLNLIQSYPEWRADGKQAAYWEIAMDLQRGVSREKIYVMSPDGKVRKKVPLPRRLCASQPSYLPNGELIFTGYRCGGVDCNCAPEAL